MFDDDPHAPLGAAIIHQQRTLLLVVLLCAFALFLWRLDSKSLWLDETLGLRVTKIGQRALWEGRSEKYHPPLYYWLLEKWIGLGETEFALRLLSVYCSVAALALTYQIARSLFDAQVGLTTLWLAAFSPLLVWYAQEARGYPVVLFFGLLSTVGLIRFLTQQDFAYIKFTYISEESGWWILHIAALIAALYTHYVALLLIPLHLGLGLLLVVLHKPTVSLRERTFLYSALVAGLIIAWLAFLPWWQTPSGAAFQKLFGGGGSYLALLVQTRLGVSASSLILAVVGASLVTLLGGIWFVRDKQFNLQQATYVIWHSRWIRMSLLLIFMASLLLVVLPRGYSIKRQLVLFWPGLLIVPGWFWPWRPRHRMLIACLVSLSLVASLVNILYVPKDPWRATVAWIIDNHQGQDAMLVAPAYAATPVGYYNQDQLAVYSLQNGAIANQIEKIFADHGRLWLIQHQHYQHDVDTATLQAWLRQHAQQVEHWLFSPIDVYLYTDQLAEDSTPE